MDVALILDRLLPGALYRGSLTDNSEHAYGQLEWLDQRPKPGWPQIAAESSAADRAVLKAGAAARRWRVQQGGTVSGLPTDDASRAAVAQAIQSIDLGIVAEPVRWKTASGFQSLTRAQLVAMAQAMAAHVQAAFDAEAAVGVEIDAGRIMTAAAVEAYAWPA